MTDRSIPPTPSEEVYGQESDQGEVFTSDDPTELFLDWFALAKEMEPDEANAMTLATANGAGTPDARIVLMKSWDARGLSFYTHAPSSKGRQLAANPAAAAVFHWKSIRRQVRFRGPVSEIPAEEADAYFAMRARSAQLGAWASQQSEPMATRAELESRVAAAAGRFEAKPVPRPLYWTGYRLAPLEIEFWVNRPFRLHDRVLFTRRALSESWERTRLYP